MRRTQTFRYTFVYAFLAGFALTGSLAANADTQVTTTTSSTRTSGSPTSFSTSYVLPSSSSYIVVDPITGVAQGSYNTVTHLVNGAPLSNGYVIVDESTRAMVAMVDQYGNIVDVAVAPAAPTLLLSIDSRRKDLEAQIADAQAKGRLAAAQAELLRQELATVTPYDASSSSSVVTYSRAIQMGSGLNSVSSRLIPITEKTYSSVIAPQFVTIDGRLTLADDLTFRKIQLTRRIEDEYAFGHITKDQLLQFKSDLTALSAREASFRNGASISATGATVMTDDLNRLQAKLDSTVVVR